MQYDLENRTKIFSKEVIMFLKRLQKDEINRHIISQLVRSATSVGANYCEANGASSQRDFKHKIFICRKEIQETKYRLELIAESNKDEKDSVEKLWKEAHELTLIFNKISTTLRERTEK
ncbi:MAG: four helix bundle protein [Candidatus Yonathbacteria bacterium]|nr:four helix bundle protein [Candidatus Yonathbacteria bacterium]NTW47466.1 four helix bundle protein [Candidatus Yonathbacteria bacterium]